MSAREHNLAEPWRDQLRHRDEHQSMGVRPRLHRIKHLACVAAQADQREPAFVSSALGALPDLGLAIVGVRRVYPVESEKRSHVRAESDQR